MCAAKACLEEGLKVTIFDRRPFLGGMWSPSPGPVFDDLTTNTACFETCISDVPPIRVTPDPKLLPEESMCMSKTQVLDYLRDFVRRVPALNAAFIPESEVKSVRAASKGCYAVMYIRNDNTHSLLFDKVIVATGLNNSPFMPKSSKLPGLEEFSGNVIHACQYKSPAQFQNQRVLVVGGSVSGSEAAGDMAMARDGEGPDHVTLCSRKMRFLVAKQKDEKVLASVVSTRFESIRRTSGVVSECQLASELQTIAESFSKNEDFDAPAPGPIRRPHEPGLVAINTKLLHASKSGAKFQWKIGGVQRFGNDSKVVFNDGDVCEYDTIIFATGYKLDFPFLDEATRALLCAKEAPTKHCDLYNFTFHPELKNLAFAGLFHYRGSIPPVFDGQARWIARVFAHPETMPSACVQMSGIREWRELRKCASFTGVVFGYDVLDRFAELGGFGVDLSVYPELTKALIYGPYAPAQFRMFGRGNRSEARKEYERQVTAAGFVVGDNKVEPEKLRELQEACSVLVAAGTGPRGLGEAVAYLTRVNC